MQRVILLSILLLAGALTSAAQKAEVLYFKAELACCQAKACDALEEDIKAIVEKNFNNETIAFKEIKFADASNKELVERYSAKSQTVVIVATKKGKESNVDVSDIVRKYNRNKNKDSFESELISKINETIK
jgi:hypothetical protein